MAFRAGETLSEPVEDCLRSIYEAQREQGRAATSVLARRLGITPASATGMVRRLAGLGLVEHVPYHGAVLTDDGRRIALQVTRRHRLIELFLATALDMPWDAVHGEADRMEHALSEELIERIDRFLGHPATDPHGSPIPSREGRIAQRRCRPLVQLGAGRAAVVAEVSDRDPALLRYVGSLGLFPGVELRVLARAPFGGPMTVQVGDASHALGAEVAGDIWVADEEGEE